MPDEALVFFAPSDKETLFFARSLARIVVPGDLILLKGELGAGKTTLARALIRSLLDQPELEVPSPTYLLVLPYEGEKAGKKTKILHADLYRLNKSDELEELGLFDDPDAIIMVEWPGRAPELFKDAAFIVALDIPSGGRGRNITLCSPQGRRNIMELAKAIGQKK